MTASLASFIRSHIRSLWALELLLLMCRDEARAWTPEELNRELRGALPLVKDMLGKFERAGLVRRDAAGLYRWSPATDDARESAAELVRHYSTHPFSVIRAITEAQSESIRSLADAFKIKKD